MKHRGIGLSVLAFALAALGVGLAQAAEVEGPKVRHIVRHRQVAYPHAIVLPPERHVIEIVKNAYSDRFIINGARFSAKSPACVNGWLAGEPVQLLSGEIHGACWDAVFYNAKRRQACEMWCGGSWFW
jgi:hypothetical protein